MNGLEQAKRSVQLPIFVLVAAAVVLIIAVASITYWVTPKGVGFSTDPQDKAIKASDVRTRELEAETVMLTKTIEELQSRPREIEYRNRTIKSKADATTEIDSIINSIDFDAQARYFTREQARLDSIFRGYKGSIDY